MQADRDAMQTPTRQKIGRAADRVQDLSSSLTKMALGPSTPPGLGADGGQWVYTTAKTRRIGFSQAEYDNIIRGLFCSSYSFNENAAARNKADLAILETVEFEIDLEAIINHVKHNEPLPSNWPFRRRVKDKVTPMLGQQQPSIFASAQATAVDDQYSSWSPPDAKTGPQKTSSISEAAAKSVKSNDEHRGRISKTLSQQNRRTNDSSGSETESAGAANPWQQASKLARAQLAENTWAPPSRVTSNGYISDASTVRNEPQPLKAPRSVSSSLSQSTVEASSKLSADGQESVVPTTTPARDGTHADASIVADQVPVPNTPRSTALPATPASTTSGKTNGKRPAKVIGARGRVLFSIKIQHEGVHHDYHVCEFDDPQLTARELKVKYRDTLEITDAWKKAFFDLFDRKLKRLHSAAAA